LIKHGKIPWSKLVEYIGMIPHRDIDVVMGPGVGEDAAVIRLRDGFLVAHVDPITAAASRIGWLAIHIAANDLAVRGVKPKWFLVTMLLPGGMSDRDVQEIFKDIGEAVKQLNGVVVGGHTEFTPGIDRPLLIVTAIGYTTGRVIMTRDAKPGDRVFIIGRVAGEGAGVIAWDFENVLIERGVDKSLIDTAKEFIRDVSVVDKALLIKDYVNSMHDPTEGGVLQGLREVALASNTSIVIDLDKLQIDSVVAEVTSVMGVNSLKLLSSGCLIATVPEGNVDIVEEVLKKHGYTYSIAGYVAEGEPGKVYLRKNNIFVETIDYDIIDEIYRLYE